MTARAITFLIVMSLTAALLNAQPDTSPRDGGPAPLSPSVPGDAADTRAPAGSRSPNDLTMFRADPARTGNLSTTPPQNGNEAWTSAIGNNFVYSSPAIVGDDVFVGANNGFYCLDLTDGTQNWKTTNISGSVISSPYVENGRVYVGSGYYSTSNGRLHCLNATTGNEYWNYNVGAAVESSPALVGSNIYFAADDGRLYSITTSGVLNWDIYLSSGHVCSSPAYWNDRIYVGSASHHHGGTTLLCVNATTGAYIWNYTANNNIVSTPAVGYGNVYFVTESGTAYCLDAIGNGDGTTDLVWTHGSGGSTSQGSGALSHGYYIYGNGASGGGSITSVDAYGDGLGGTTQRWTVARSTPGKFGFEASIAVTGGQVFGAHGDGTMYAFHESNGTQIWSYASGVGSYGLMSGPSVSKGYCMAGGDDGTLYCVGGPVIAPVVESVAPAGGSVGVALDSVVQATFDLNMTPALLSTSTFTLTDSGDQPVGGAVSYNAGSKTATFTPSADLAEGEAFTATLLGTVQDVLGIGLDGDGDGEAEGSPADDYSWTFTTVELNAPALSAVPVQEPVEDVEYELDLEDYISDADTPLNQLIFGHNSSYVEDETGFVLTFLYPEGVLWEGVNVSVSDGTKETWGTVRFDVTPVNDPPELASISPRSATEDIGGRTDISTYITDIDTPVDADHFTLEEDSAHVEVEGLELVYTYPEGVLHDTFNITLTDHGIYPTDSDESALGVVTVNVQPVNDGPYIQNPGDQTVDEDDLLEVVFTVIDPDDDGFTFDIDTPDSGVLLPESLAVDDDTMTLSVRPSNDDVGVYNLTVTVEDTGGEEDSADFTLTVLNVNDAPPASFIRYSATDAWPETQTIDENLTLRFTCDEVVDIDGDALTYRWDFDDADGVDDSVTGLDVMNTYPFGGNFTVTLTVDDGNGGTNATSKVVTVYPVPEPGVEDGEDGGDGGETDGEDGEDGGDGGVTDGGGGDGGGLPGDVEGADDDEKSATGTGTLAAVIAIVAVVIVLILLLIIRSRKKKQDTDTEGAPMTVPDQSGLDGGAQSLAAPLEGSATGVPVAAPLAEPAHVSAVAPAAIPPEAGPATIPLTAAPAAIPPVATPAALTPGADPPLALPPAQGEY